MTKFTILLKRKASLTHEALLEHHRTVHADLFMSMPVVKDTVRRYVQQHGVPAELHGMPPPKYDGVTELWFDDVEAIGRCFSDPEYLSVIRPDEESFLDLHGCDFIVSNERVVEAGPTAARGRGSQNVLISGRWGREPIWAALQP